MSGKTTLVLKAKGLGVSEELSLNIVHFADGSQKLVVDNIDKFRFVQCFTIELYATSMDDLMLAGMLVDVIKRNSFVHVTDITLHLLSPLYMRYDRVMHRAGNDSFALKVYASVIESLGVTKVVTRDAHSRVLSDILNSGDVAYSDIHLYAQVMDTMGYSNLAQLFEEYIVIAPDSGAKVKLDQFWGKGRVLSCKKNRNPETGVISGFNGIEFTEEYPDVDSINNSGKSLIILDDICERGGTFFGVAGAIRELEITVPISLYVTHGVMPKGTKFENLASVFDGVYINSMLEQRFLDAYNSVTEAGGSFFCKNIYRKYWN